MSDGVAPLDDAVHDVAGIVLLVGAESLRVKKKEERQKHVTLGISSKRPKIGMWKRWFTNRFDVVVEGAHEVGSGDLQLLRSLHVDLHRGRGLQGTKALIILEFLKHQGSLITFCTSICSEVWPGNHFFSRVFTNSAASEVHLTRKVPLYS